MEPQQLVKWHDPTLIGQPQPDQRSDSVQLLAKGHHSDTRDQFLTSFSMLCSTSYNLQGKFSRPKSGSNSSFPSSIASGRVSCTKETPIKAGGKEEMGTTKFLLSSIPLFY